ncbi:carboxymuconolactone decarboxylase family protein [Citricoccus nitrophenolicus]|uniref:Carboxymuconolactone decarboxylase family protein n=1 Tax=Citricoccus nitrophenolicus TaxID=863575 RepID=A0ABV0IJT0_9MICC
MYIPVVPESEATGVLADFYRRHRGSWGFLPDYAQAFSTHPEVAAAWDQLNLAVRDGLERRLYEIATIAAARALRSSYCTAAHTKFLRDVCGDAQAARDITEQPDGSRLSDRDREAYEFAGRIATDAAAVEQRDIDRLHEAGLNDGEIAGIVFTAASRSFFTRVLDGLGARLDAETAGQFSAEELASIVVGRGVAED